MIALTHRRTPKDIRLAENVHEVDLILGGHDHVMSMKKEKLCNLYETFICMVIPLIGPIF